MMALNFMDISEIKKMNFAIKKLYEYRHGI
jgi:hypothetical protein